MTPANDLGNSIQYIHQPPPKIGEVFTWERPINNPGILALIRPSHKPLWRTEFLDEEESEEDEAGNTVSKSNTSRILQLCDVSDDEYEDGHADANESIVRQVGRSKEPRFTKITALRKNESSPTGTTSDYGTAHQSSKTDSFTCIGDGNYDLKLVHSRKRRFGLFHNQNQLSKDYAGPQELLPFHDWSVNGGPLRRNGWLVFKTMANIPNSSVFKCKRFHIRRNAICDPFNLLMPQKTREKTEWEALQRKKSFFRRMKIFFRVKFGIEGEEDL